MNGGEQHIRRSAAGLIGVALCLSGSGCGGLPEPGQENILQNGSFEEELRYPVWQHSADEFDYLGEETVATMYHMRRVESGQNSGNHILKTWGIGPGTVYSGPMPCTAGDTCLFSGMFASRDLSSEYRRPEGALVHIVFYDGREKVVSWIELAAFSGTADWKNVQKKYVVPEQAITMRLFLRFRVIAKGEWMIDDLSIRRI